MLVVVLTGAINAGKTTTGRALAKILPDAVFFDGDDHDAPDDASLEARIEASFVRLVQLIEAATSRVVVIAVPLRGDDFLRLRAACSDRQADLRVVTLAPPLAIALSNRGDRHLRPHEIVRARQMLAEGYADRDFSDFTIADVTNAEDTARRICRHLELSVSQC
ncbi:MAG: shikimate kinase [Devosia sp.]